MTVMHVSQSNSLADLAARIKIEHTSLTASLRQGLKHAMAAGDLLIEAKKQVKHGQWLPWLRDYCEISDRTAQLYMQVAKNRAEIESSNPQPVADLTLNEAAALLAMSADLKKLFAFVKEVEATDDPDQIVTLAVEHGFLVMHDPNYDPFHHVAEEDRKDWHLFVLFLVVECGRSVYAASHHVEWLLNHQFKNVAEWLGPEGDKFAWWWRTPPGPSTVRPAWDRFSAEHTSMTAADIEAELVRLRDYLDSTSGVHLEADR